MPATFEHILAIGRSLPGTIESTSYGTPALKVRGKTIARLWEDGTTLVLKTTFEDRDFLLEADPKVFFVTDHYRGYPAILIRLGRVRRAQLRELLEVAWRGVASKTDIAEFDAQRS